MMIRSRGGLTSYVGYGALTLILMYVGFLYNATKTSLNVCEENRLKLKEDKQELLAHLSVAQEHTKRLKASVDDCRDSLNKCNAGRLEIQDAQTECVRESNNVKIKMKNKENEFSTSQQEANKLRIQLQEKEEDCTKVEQKSLAEYQKLVKEKDALESNLRAELAQSRAQAQQLQQELANLRQKIQQQPVAQQQLPVVQQQQQPMVQQHQHPIVQQNQQSAVQQQQQPVVQQQQQPVVQQQQQPVVQQQQQPVVQQQQQPVVQQPQQPFVQQNEPVFQHQPIQQQNQQYQQQPIVQQNPGIVRQRPIIQQPNFLVRQLVNNPGQGIANLPRNEPVRKVYNAPPNGVNINSAPANVKNSNQPSAHVPPQQNQPAVKVEAPVNSGQQRMNEQNAGKVGAQDKATPPPGKSGAPLQHVNQPTGQPLNAKPREAAAADKAGRGVAAFTEPTKPSVLNSIIKRSVNNNDMARHGPVRDTGDKVVGVNGQGDTNIQDMNNIADAVKKAEPERKSLDKPLVLGPQDVNEDLADRKDDGYQDEIDNQHHRD